MAEHFEKILNTSNLLTVIKSYGKMKYIAGEKRDQFIDPKDIHAANKVAREAILKLSKTTTNTQNGAFSDSTSDSDD